MERIRWKCLILIAVLLVIAGQTPGQTGVSSSAGGSIAIEPSLFGITLNDPQDYPTIPFGTLGKSPAVGWWWVEKTSGNYDFSLFDQYVEVAQAHGIDYIYELGNSVPPWASSNPTQPCNNPYLGGLGCAAPPTNIQDWDNYVTAVVTHYKGQVKFYELWNEPNNPESWSGTCAQMVSLAKAAYSIVKSIDPDAMVLTPATTGPEAAPPGLPTPARWLQNYLQAGGNLYADIGTFHGYIADTSVSPSPMPEQSNSSANCGVDCFVSITTKVDLFRSVLNKNGLQNAPLFDTEGGWNLKNPPDDDTKVEFLSRWYILQAAQGVARVVWYLWGDSAKAPDASLGTSNAPLSSAATAYEQVYNWLSGASFTRPCSASGTVWSCHLTRPNGYQGLIVWNTAGSSTLNVSSRYIQFQDLTGNTTNVSGGTVTIGLKPILLENGDPPIIG
jgi:polysaccharide biosynthesis protein PslG